MFTSLSNLSAEPQQRILQHKRKFDHPPSAPSRIAVNKSPEARVLQRSREHTPLRREMSRPPVCDLANQGSK